MNAESKPILNKTGHISESTNIVKQSEDFL